MTQRRPQADSFATKKLAKGFADNCGRQVVEITHSRIFGMWTVWTNDTEQGLEFSSLDMMAAK